MAEDDRVAAREAPLHPPQATLGGARVVDDADAHLPDLDLPGDRQALGELRDVDVAQHGVDGRAEPLEQVEDLRGDQVPGVDDQVGGPQALQAGGRQLPRALGQVGVREERDPGHAGSGSVSTVSSWA